MSRQSSKDKTQKKNTNVKDNIVCRGVQNQYENKFSLLVSYFWMFWIILYNEISLFSATVSPYNYSCPGGESDWKEVVEGVGLNSDSKSQRSVVPSVKSPEVGSVFLLY